jgi:hypothetical protein
MVARDQTVVQANEHVSTPASLDLARDGLAAENCIRACFSDDGFLNWE